ncbi:hypothetical protein A2334_05230 [Candidatus Roizmanbacteria bacterium RIFOXYB2_FULL_38_10]|uniref:Uncharacterized protein n=1 Tax=Candidatus Roizmanbacteria bacterium RIFOXYD1_FULL_38_12 TaxID=1802093 RepID=A0A1F7KZV8_9BACT|nr:MAG: hypothetical protein A3K47_01330 [Candidatus Roizmanbacteria bacterium RIFOXYA2_FULL_38_14]OGK63427.1 MAG: hypothetical protein A3K27_01330 [Candidatus Roizmanbacteria bacterium RIFOXYA1_FULL_37_12]OGK65273.1 MAG: hypothetical protein A3K38_01330 [Candidatus Roizmanbacteria bacterium RIFOXYB1_FULL_40_23]OGK68826.1 MAG: hypothetical protein A2334_05230 [Candidatus Roizmanbacteria bacterium RIFOXYB2_FULL_38_10]OGK69678.1 MAG: hypothetical protein A3K21_01335 [Candidatus Roizmanbacteria ba
MKKIEVLILSVAIFFTIIAWVIIDIYHIQQKINDQIDVKPATIPNYQMDQKIIDVLKQKVE